MVSLIGRVLALVVGLLLVSLGIVGLFLPFLQGFLLIFLGLSVMSLVSQRAARVLGALKSWVRARFGGGSKQRDAAETKDSATAGEG